MSGLGRAGSAGRSAAILAVNNCRQDAGAPVARAQHLRGLICERIKGDKKTPILFVRVSRRQQQPAACLISSREPIPAFSDVGRVNTGNVGRIQPGFARRATFSYRNA